MIKRPAQRSAPIVTDAPEPDDSAEAVVMITSTIHMPAELLNALRSAANRRSMRRINGGLGDGKSKRPSVSEMVVEMLTRHRDELDEME